MDTNTHLVGQMDMDMTREKEMDMVTITEMGQAMETDMDIEVNLPDVMHPNPSAQPCLF